MKSLLISKVFPPETGGSGRWFWEIYRRLPKEEYAIIAGDHPNAADFDQSHDLQLHRIPLTFPDWGYFSWNGYQQYKSAVKEITNCLPLSEFNCIHAGSLLPDGWVARLLAKKFQLPLIVYMHGEETCYANSSRQLRWMSERILKDADCVVANSFNTERILRENWSLPADKINVLHPGVDCEQLVPAQRDDQIRDRYGWKGRKVILTVGRLQERKGQDILIQALPTLVRSFPEVIYAIVGDGADFERLNHLVQELSLQEYIQFFRDFNDEQIRDCYQQCDLFVLPNRQVGEDIEGFGMVLLEAQACGKGVIAGNSGGTSETMKVGETGHLVDCDTPDALCELIVSSLQDEETLKAMGQQGRDWVLEKFDWHKLSLEAKSLFEQTRRH